MLPRRKSEDLLTECSLSRVLREGAAEVREKTAAAVLYRCGR